MVARSPINVLYVDDEVNNLFSFKAMFRLKYQVHIASNIEEAHKILEAHTIHVFLTDQKMPQISGLELVDIVKVKYKKPVSILVTGCAPEKDVNMALANGSIFSCITKPWDEGKLDETVMAAYAQYNLQNTSTEKAPISSLILTNPFQKPHTSLHAY